MRQREEAETVDQQLALIRSRVDRYGDDSYFYNDEDGDGDPVECFSDASLDCDLDRLEQLIAQERSLIKRLNGDADEG